MVLDNPCHLGSPIRVNQESAEKASVIHRLRKTRAERSLRGCVTRKVSGPLCDRDTGPAQASGGRQGRD